MKKALLILLFTGTALCAYAQTELYISRQTGQYTSYNGNYSKSTDRYENGTVNLSTQGPIVYTVNPAQLSIAPNETKSWDGTVYPDINNAPAPGTSVNAQLTGDYSIGYSRPQGLLSGALGGGVVTGTYNCESCYFHTNGGGVHELVRKTGTQNLSFIVHSINVTAPDTKSCPNTDINLAAEGYPTGGTYAWTAGPNTVITGGQNSDVVQFKSTAVGAGSLTVTYTIAGIKYSKTVAITCEKPVVTLNVGDEVEAAVGKQFTITPTVTPRPGSANWSVSNGLTLNSGPYNYVAFITPTQPGNHTVTLKMTVCNQVITKTVKVKVNPCLVTVPDKVSVLVGQTVDITANGNMNGTYAWTAGGNAQVQSGANQQTVTIKGTAKGDGWAEVTFTGNGCSDKKKVKIEVKDKPTLTVDVAYAPMTTMCKTERRILTARYDPPGGTVSWSLSSNSLKYYGPAGNNPTVVVEADKGGPCTVTCTYTLAGQSVSVDLTTTVREYSKVVVTASNNANELASGTAVTYTATAYDHTGAVANPQPTFHWKVVYIPLGQENNAANWYSYDLQGGGAQQNYTWSFPQGAYPLPAGSGPPYKMGAWIEAAEYCTYRSGSVHIKVVSQNGKN